MFRRLGATGCILVFLAGCAAPAEPASVDREPIADGEDAAVVGRLPFAAGLDWNTLWYRHSAPAGGWLVVQQNFTPRQEVDYTYWLNVTFQEPSADGPTMWLLQRPALVRLDGNESSVLPSTTLGQSPDAEPLSESAGDAAATGGNFTGFLAAFAANTAWELEITIKLGKHEYPMVTPSHRANGTGTQFTTTFQRAPEAQGPLGIVTIDAQIADAGWTHLQQDTRRLTTNGVRRWQVDFPSGSTSGFGGHALFFGFGMQSTWDRWDDGPGAFHARFEYGESDLAFSLSLAHAPMPPDAFPAWIRRPA